MHDRPASEGIRVAEWLVRGAACGAVLKLDAPLSLLCMDQSDGRITDHHHPQYGESVARRILALPCTRGGPATAGFLTECVRRGSAPAAIVVTRREPGLLVAGHVADLLYGRSVPIALVSFADFENLHSGQVRSIDHSDTFWREA